MCGYVALILILTRRGIPMFSTTYLLCALFLTLPAFGNHDTLEKRPSSTFLGTCNQIAKAVSDASQVFFPRR